MLFLLTLQWHFSVTLQRFDSTLTTKISLMQVQVCALIKVLQKRMLDGTSLWPLPLETVDQSTVDQSILTWGPITLLLWSSQPYHIQYMVFINRLSWRRGPVNDWFKNWKFEHLLFFFFTLIWQLPTNQPTTVKTNSSHVKRNVNKGSKRKPG